MDLERICALNEAVKILNEANDIVAKPKSTVAKIFGDEKSDEQVRFMVQTAAVKVHELGILSDEEKGYLAERTQDLDQRLDYFGSMISGSQKYHELKRDGRL